MILKLVFVFFCCDTTLDLLKKHFFFFKKRVCICNGKLNITWVRGAFFRMYILFIIFEEVGPSLALRPGRMFEPDSGLCPQITALGTMRALW